MKKLLSVAFALLLGSPIYAADLTAGVVSPNGQVYNAAVRDVKDGTNAPTQDVVTANVYANAITTNTVVKASGGYLDNITLLALCSGGTTNYVVADTSVTLAPGAAGYQAIISTIPANTVAPINIPIHVRFNTGLLLSVFSSTCPVTVSYR